MPSHARHADLATTAGPESSGLTVAERLGAAKAYRSTVCKTSKRIGHQLDRTLPLPWQIHSLSLESRAHVLIFGSFQHSKHVPAGLQCRLFHGP